MSGLGTWSAQQLAEFLAVVSSFPDEQSTLLGAVERAAEAVEAEVAALLRDDEVVVAVGFPRDRVPIDDLVRLAHDDSAELDVPGVGRCVVARIPIDRPFRATLVLARSGPAFDREEAGLLRGMARVLGLTVERLGVVAGLRERQALLERLFTIQRSISHRAPIDGVLDAITQGAAELLGDEVVGLRLVDEDDADHMVLVSSVGIPPELLGELRRVPVSQGVGGRCILEQQLVISDEYQSADLAIPQLVADGLQAAMAAPVHRNGTVVGSLVVGTHRTGRRYTASEQEVLLAFAEHASLALNDASALEAMRRAFGEAVHQATHDALTGLPNRTLVIDRLTHALDRARRNPRGQAVLFVDLDRFKVVNDSLGHSVGDEVLVQIAERLQSAVRPGDTVSRLAGDEFVVVCEDLTEEADLLGLGERVAQAIARPLHLYGRDTIITASIGIAIASPGTTAEDLLRDADVAMYRAKERGRSRIELFDQDMRTRMLDRLETEHELRVALQQGSLVLHYQPTVCLTTGRVLSLEALVRWQHPTRGVVAPAEFVGLAEETGLIVPLGRWALRSACEQLAAWRATQPELDTLQVSVNLSARQFADPHLVSMVADALRVSGLPSDRLWLEITESVLMEEAEATVDTLRALRALGVRISIDDFGTGYSSLSYLKRFPVDVLKIDRSFVDGLGVDPEDQAIVTAIVGLARALGLGVVAEGVETPEQLDEVRRLGCNSVQGYYLGRPQAADDLLGRLLSTALVG